MLRLLWFTSLIAAVFFLLQNVYRYDKTMLWQGVSCLGVAIWSLPIHGWRRLRVSAWVLIIAGMAAGALTLPFMTLYVVAVVLVSTSGLYEEPKMFRFLKRGTPFIGAD